MKLLNALLLWVLLSDSSNVLAQCWLEDKITGKKFRVFNALLYQDQPDMKDLCIEDINVIYAWHFFPKGHKRNDFEMPKSDVLTKAINKAALKNKLTVIDIEHWGLKSEHNAKSSVKNYLSIINQFKTQAPKLEVGYYGVVPIIDFSRAKLNENSSRYKNWVTENNRVKPIANIIDATFPSLYTINSNKKSWLSRASAQISESKRLAKNKPVYPFIWPNYHTQGGRYPKGYEVAKEYWRLQLDFLRENANGIVLWGGYKQTFNERMQWWLETKKFLADSFIFKEIEISK